MRSSLVGSIITTVIVVLLTACSEINNVEEPNSELDTVKQTSFTAPILISPSDGDTNSSPQVSFKWFSAGEGVLYRLYVKEYVDSPIVLLKDSITDTVVTVDLEKGKTYSWAVSAFDKSGKELVSSFSSLKIFLPTAAHIGDFAPLTIGNQWVYGFKGSNSAGTSMGGSYAQEGVDTFTVKSITVSNDSNVYVIERRREVINGHWEGDIFSGMTYITDTTKSVLSINVSAESYTNTCSVKYSENPSNEYTPIFDYHQVTDSLLQFNDSAQAYVLEFGSGYSGQLTYMQNIGMIKYHSYGGYGTSQWEWDIWLNKFTPGTAN